MQNKYSEYYPEYYPERYYYSKKYSLTDTLGTPTPKSKLNGSLRSIGEVSPPLEPCFRRPHRTAVPATVAGDASMLVHQGLVTPVGFGFGFAVRVGDAYNSIKYIIYI